MTLLRFWIGRIAPMFLVVGLVSCAGSQAWEQAFSPDANTENWGQTNGNASPNPTPQLPPDLQFPQASLRETIPLETGQQETRWQSSQPPLAIQGFYQQRLGELGWTLQPPRPEGQQLILQARNTDQEFRLTLNPPSNTGTEFQIVYGPAGSPLPTPTATPSPNALSPQTFSDLDQAPTTLQPVLRDLADLGVLSAATGQGNEFKPNQPMDRGTYARWLVTAHNRFYQDRPARQIRLGTDADSPLFADVPKTNPNFPYIQGLAAAGYLPSSLTGSSIPLFRPAAPLTREALLQWKVPLDIQRNLTTTSIDRIEQTWGFKDSNRITPEALSATAADFQNGDLSNIRRIFGATLLLQPQKPVTRAEAAASLWYMGNQAGEGLSAQDVLATNQPAAN